MGLSVDRFVNIFRPSSRRGIVRGGMHYDELIVGKRCEEKKGDGTEPVETARDAVDLTRLETKLHLFPFEFARSDTYVLQCFKTADYSNYWQRERVYAASSQRVKRHRPLCKVSLMLPRITSVCMYMHVCPMCACGFGSAGGRGGGYTLSARPRKFAKHDRERQMGKP